MGLRDSTGSSSWLADGDLHAGRVPVLAESGQGSRLPATAFDPKPTSITTLSV